MGLYRYYRITNETLLVSADFDRSPQSTERIISERVYLSVVKWRHGNPYAIVGIPRMAINSPNLFLIGCNGANDSVVEINRNDKQEVSVILKLRNLCAQVYSFIVP